MRWRSYWYRHNFKVLVDLAQAVLAGLLALVIAYQRILQKHRQE